MQDLNDKINNGGATAQGQLSADEWNEIPSEIQAVITSVGQALSGGDLTQLVKAIVSYSSNGNFFADSGIADAYVLTALGAKQGLYAYGDGSRVAFVPSFNNTGAATVNVSTLGVKDIKLSNGNDLAVGDIIADEILELVYDLANDYFVLIRLLTETVYTELNRTFNSSRAWSACSMTSVGGTIGTNLNVFSTSNPSTGVYRVFMTFGASSMNSIRCLITNRGNNTAAESGRVYKTLPITTQNIEITCQRADTGALIDDNFDFVLFDGGA